MVGGISADLPDAGIGFRPLCRHKVGKPAHGPPRFRIERVAAVHQDGCRVQHPAVTVQLVLTGRAVAGPHRPAPRVAGPALKHPFPGNMPAGQRQQCGEPGALEPAGMQQPAEESEGFVGFACPQKGADADACVPRPGVPVVPVPYSAGVLRQGCCGGGDRSARGGVSEQPEGEQAPQHVRAERHVRVDRLRPGLPPLFVPAEQVPGCRWVQMDERFPVRQCEDQCHRPAGMHGQGLLRAAFQRKPRTAAQRERQWSPLADDVPAAFAHPWPAVVFAQARIETDDGGHRGTFSTEPPDKERRREKGTRHFGHHRLRQGQPSPAGLPNGFQGGGVAPVPARCQSSRSGGTCQKPAGLLSSQQGTEDGFAVESRSTHPVHRSPGGHQGRRPGVAHQAVVGDGCRLPGVGGKGRWVSRKGWCRGFPAGHGLLPRPGPGLHSALNRSPSMAP